MARATLNKDGIATRAGDLTVYNYDGVTREYLSASIEYLTIGVGVPANSCTDAPADEKLGFAICRAVSFDGWDYVIDHRGKTVYDTETGQPTEITVPGEYADNVTMVVPSTQYDRWNGSAWVTDESAEKSGQIMGAQQKKNVLLEEAQSTITLWQTELQLGMISDDDKASLIVWMKYIKVLQAVDTSTAPDIVWPLTPEK